MQTVLLVIHLMLVAALIGVVLVQRSEGGALGIGGGGNFMAARSTGNVLTRATTILAAAFFVTSIGLTILARNATDGGAIFENLPANALTGDPGVVPTGGGVLNLLGGAAPTTPTVPDEAGGTPATPDAAVPAVPDEAGAATPPAAEAAGETPPPAAGETVTPPAETPAPTPPASL